MRYFYYFYRFSFGMKCFVMHLVKKQEHKIKNDNGKIVKFVNLKEKAKTSLGFLQDILSVFS